MQHAKYDRLLDFELQKLIYEYMFLETKLKVVLVTSKLD